MAEHAWDVLQMVPPVPQDTQQATPSTQDVIDPRRLGRNRSGLSDTDVADVICILHPCSLSAYRIVQDTARRNVQYILHNQGLTSDDRKTDSASASEADTLVERNDAPRTDRTVHDIALRFSSSVCDPSAGFGFGRNIYKCDVNLDPTGNQRRVSNIHFRIYINGNGVLMMRDCSTNGTLVDMETLGGKRDPNNPKQRMLSTGNAIEILSPEPNDLIKFIVRIPDRSGYQEQYNANLKAHLEHIAVAQNRLQEAGRGGQMPDPAKRRILAAPFAGPPNAKEIATSSPAQWDGAGKYNIIGCLGKGAFAVVYQVAVVYSGEVYAAKELEKRRFVKNGVLDTRLDNEMQIMKDLRHPNIVQYIAYEENEHHLYILMEYIPGGDLQAYLGSHGTLHEPFAKSMSRQVLGALEYLHKKNITHRDIKPDNVLICSEDPFAVKLTDFGLSKVVKNNETFLKTFCGTLLYCAPEVFPHYDGYVTNQRHKRRRQHQSDQASHRRYSQLVDIWSYAAVLWTSLCGKPPFEPITDGNGKGMFENIMESELDFYPLIQKEVSEEARDLLGRMLATDPMARPSDRECLDHAWLSEELASEEQDVGLLQAMEEADDELDASQLSINDREQDETTRENGDQNSQGSSQHSDSRGKKRMKSEIFASEGQAGDIPIFNAVHGQARQDASPHAARTQKLFGEISQPALQSSDVVDIGDEARLWEQGGAHDSRTAPAYQDNPGSDFDVSETEERSEWQGNLAHRSNSPGAGDNHEPADHDLRTSLTGAESMVRGLNVDSPKRGTSITEGGRHRAQTPVTPSAFRSSSTVPKSTGSGNAGADVTPKQPIFDRRIELAVPPSAFYDPQDPSTHNVEYASRVSGINFKDESSTSNLADKSLPDTVAASFRSAHASKSGGKLFQYQEKENQPEQRQQEQQTVAGQQSLSPHVHVPAQSQAEEQVIHSTPPAPPSSEPQVQQGQQKQQQTQPSTASGSSPPAPTNAPTRLVHATDSTGQFTKPIPPLGRLASTPDSFVPNLVITMTSLVTSWGRLQQTTHPYPDIRDTRIPKIGLELWFHAPGIEEADRKGQDWTQLPGLHVVVRTQSRNGVHVNGVLLKDKDESTGRQLYGRLREGDEIVVFEDAQKEQRLAFVAEGLVNGSGGGVRRDGEKRFVVQMASAAGSSGSGG
ncbi:MAG: hypothetical protein M1831_002817 [Alyxoria varia]|nr:MAG: hypothetical protein M1831_002817 [Alyxoria varia]